MNKQVARYMNEIKRGLALPRSERKKLLAGLGQEIDEYLLLNPKADYSDLVNTFGAPRAVLEEIVGDNDSLLEMRRRYRKRQRILLVSVIGLLLILVLCVGYLYIDMCMHYEDVYVIETIYEGPEY